MACVRSAWLVLGARTVMLEDVAHGWACESLDLGYPTVRAVTNNRPDKDGVDDRTQIMGERAAAASITALASMGAQIDAIAASFAPFMVPAARPVLHYVLDRPGAPERTLTLRAAGYGWPIAGPYQRDIQLQWVAPDPIARDVTQKSGTSYPGASAASGRRYNLVFPRVYPSGGGGPSTATLYSAGDVDVRPLLRIYGPVTAPVVSFAPSCGAFAMLPTMTISGGHYVEVDCQMRTAWFDGDRAQNVLTQADWVTIAAQGWPRLPPATTVTMTMTGQSTSGSTQCQATWNDGYLS